MVLWTPSNIYTSFLFLCDCLNQNLQNHLPEHNDREHPYFTLRRCSPGCFTFVWCLLWVGGEYPLSSSRFLLFSALQGLYSSLLPNNRVMSSAECVFCISLLQLSTMFLTQLILLTTQGHHKQNISITAWCYEMRLLAPERYQISVFF